MPEKINIAIFGMGKIGKIRFDILKNHPNVAEISFYDPMVPFHSGILSVESSDQIFNDRTIDVVFICTPTYLVKETSIKAIKASNHVFCEKPPGMTFEESEAIHMAVENNSSILFKFGFNHRYMSHYLELKKLIDTNTYGEIKWIKGVYGKGYDQAFLSNWRSKKEMSGGGIFIDQGIHLLDLILHLVGDLEVVHAMVDQLHTLETSVEDNVLVHLRSKNKIPVAFQSSAVHWKHSFRLEVVTEKALLVIDGVKSSTRSYGEEKLTIHHKWNNNSVETINIKRNEQDYYTNIVECHDFLDSVINGRPIKHGTTAEAMKLMKLVKNVYTFGSAVQNGS